MSGYVSVCACVWERWGGRWHRVIQRCWNKTSSQSLRISKSVRNDNEPQTSKLSGRRRLHTHTPYDTANANTIENFRVGVVSLQRWGHFHFHSSHSVDSVVHLKKSALGFCALSTITKFTIEKCMENHAMLKTTTTTKILLKLNAYLTDYAGLFKCF